VILGEPILIMKVENYIDHANLLGIRLSPLNLALAGYKLSHKLVESQCTRLGDYIDG
jgi:hypothetical protein